MKNNYDAALIVLYEIYGINIWKRFVIVFTGRVMMFFARI